MKPNDTHNDPAPTEHHGVHNDPENHNGGEATGHSHSKVSSHGGQVVMTGKYHFEVVFHKDEIHVYLYDSAQKAASFQGVSGKITLEYKNGPSKELPLSYVGMKSGVSPDHLMSKVDLSAAKAGEIKAVIRFTGLPGQDDPIAVKYVAHQESEQGEHEEPDHSGHDH